MSDFLRRWGRRFRYMIVMDADSVMKGEALVRMVRIMQADDAIGILQSAPSLINSVITSYSIHYTKLYDPW